MSYMCSRDVDCTDGARRPLDKGGQHTYISNICFGKVLPESDREFQMNLVNISIDNPFHEKSCRKLSCRISGYLFKDCIR